MGPVALIVAHAESLLAEEPGGHLKTLLDIMATAAADDGLTLTLCADPGQETSLRQRVTAALR